MFITYEKKRLKFLNTINMNQRKKNKIPQKHNIMVITKYKEHH